ncbi:methyltransferase domain-containing protein [Noviherbaspirillum suwonense]|jgi:SAM-dependent methyltransferase|uniref:Methyltransferase domain-containing protein n=1 Tax=Noviherbaspirillum suwonense TaxID=1224511 RepID=A0ABY1QMA8_9BURK|nr:class I SAM-dependent methyltransferase [Noviherbaspirillum suwonense]SMP74011.1 Methyltransferase domain-containing protein [Noviherbaspirillum suwonense]
MTQAFLRRLIDRAATPYRSAGRFAWHFARGKLGGDPVFAGLLEHGLIPDRARVLDIGCGQGLLASWLLSAQAMHAAGDWPAHWPAAPAPRALHGIELMPKDVERARRALGGAAVFTAADMCKADFGSVDAVVVLDVLHYVDIPAQDDVLSRIRDALAPRGVLVLRVGDAGGGWPFRFSVWVDHVVTFVRGHRNSRLHCRTLADWKAALSGLGFSVRSLPMNKGTPFANILLVAELDQAARA